MLTLRIPHLSGISRLWWVQSLDFMTDYCNWQVSGSTPLLEWRFPVVRPDSKEPLPSLPPRRLGPGSASLEQVLFPWFLLHSLEVCVVHTKETFALLPRGWNVPKSIFFCMEYLALFTYLLFISYDLMNLILLLGYNIDCVCLLGTCKSLIHVKQVLYHWPIASVHINLRQGLAKLFRLVLLFFLFFIFGPGRPWIFNSPASTSQKQINRPKSLS